MLQDANSELIYWNIINPNLLLESINPLLNTELSNF